MNVLDALGPIPRPLVTVDFELYYSKDYSLSKLTTEAYVRDPRFEVVGVGVKLNTQPSVWMEEGDFRRWAGAFPWQSVRVLAHHAHLEGLILSHHYGIRPKFWLDTLSMSRALHGPGGPDGKGHSLEALAEHHGVGRKGDELEQTKGKRRRDFSSEEWLRFGVYGCTDVDLTYQLAAQMVPTLPPAELWLIDTTIRMFSEPIFEADQDVLAQAFAEEQARKTELLARIAKETGGGDARAILSSADRFAELLRRLGEEPGTKQGKKGTIYAFAQSDPYMQGLLEHEREDLRFLAEARLAVKSTIIETRSKRLAETGRRGRVPFYLKYAGAHTHRWSGGDKGNPQNYNRGGALRAAILAPAELPDWADGYA